MREELFKCARCGEWLSVDCEPAYEARDGELYCQPCGEIADRLYQQVEDANKMFSVVVGGLGMKPERVRPTQKRQEPKKDTNIPPVG